MPARFSAPRYAAWVLFPCFLLLSGSSSLPATLDPTRDKILYVVANAHLDDQWNWTIQDTINSHIPKTLNQNFALFAAYPDYVFSFEEAWRYELIREYYPADFATLSNHVAQGRWRLAGSSLVAGDVNVPSPESLIRQILYAQTYWKRTFGKTSVDIFLPDCFGFGYALPSVAAHCGLKGFSSQKLSWGSAIPIPFQNIGRWIGPDGASVVAVLQPGSYVSSITGNLANDSTYYSRITNMHALSGLYLDYRYFGTGDTGGAPDNNSVNWLQQSVSTTNGLINVLSAASDQLFRDLSPAHVAQLPTYQGEFLLKTHGAGCYTAHPEVKRFNRQNELRADAAERAAVIADWLHGGGSYPQEKLNAAWTRFLWHQFHDDLTGTSIPAAYPFSWNDYALSLNEFKAVQTQAIGILAGALNTTAVGVPVVVYNPLAMMRQDVVEAEVSFPEGAPPAVRVFNPSGVEVPAQMGAPVGNRVPVTFLANVPPVGAMVYDVRPAAEPSSLSTGLSVSATHLENVRYRVELNASGDVASIYDKLSSRELLSAPIRWDFLYNQSTVYPAWEILYANVAAAPVTNLAGPATFEVTENGPARVCLSVTRAQGGSIFTERLRLAAGEAGDRLEWDVTANWRTRQTLLKVRFPLAVSNAKATYDLGLGTIERGNANANLYEVPAQQWVDLTHSNGLYGVTLLSDSRYGWDKPNDSTLRLTIFHTPAVGSSYVYQATNGFGVHRLGFALRGHAGDWRNGGAPWVAARYNQPLQAFQTRPHAGALGKTFAFLSCNNTNVMVKAVKKAENSSEWIVRLQELSGSSQTAELTCASAILSAREVNGAEEPICPLSPVGGKLSVPLGAYAPKTVALTLAPAPIVVPKPASLPVALPFNRDVISSDANRADGQFDGGWAYPAELMPPTLVREGITFQLGPASDGAFNAVACEGQTVPLPAAGYNQLCFLAAAASNVTTGTFTVGGQSTNLTVQYFTGFVGQWDPPALVGDEVGWITTHRHTAGGVNDAYRFCYLFKYRLDLPAGTDSIVLPQAPNIRVFAMTLVTNAPWDTVPAGGPLAENLPPWASAGVDQRVNAVSTNGPAWVRLDGSGSRDADGVITSYVWSVGGSLLATGINPEVSLPLGTNDLVLAVTDDRGATSHAMVKIVVLPPLTVAVSAGAPSAGSAPATVQFTGQAWGEGLGWQPYDTTDDRLGTVTAQGENPPNEVATCAFDNLTTTKWLDFANSYPSTHASWIQYRYASGMRYVVTNYTLTSANDAPARDPADWALLGSNDEGVSWTTLDTRTGQTFTTRFEKRAFRVASPGAYSLYRLRVDRVANPSSANSVQLAEIELLGEPLFVYTWLFGDGASTTATVGGTPSAVQHTYTNNGTFTVTLGAAYGGYTGTNTTQVTIGPPLAATLAAAPARGAVPLAVQFAGQASAGTGGRGPYDTTDDPLGLVTAQGENPPNELAIKAFDNSLSTKWLDFASGYPATRSSWIQYQYPNGQRFALSHYTIASANDAMTYPARNPRDWRLLGSNDGGGSWDTVDMRTGQTFTANYQRRAFAVTNTSAYNAYRLQIDSVSNPASANSVQLSELEFITVPPPYDYEWAFGDGTFSTEQNPRHTYTIPGTYLVSLVVWDGLSRATNTTTIQVLPPPSLTISAGSAGSVTLEWPVDASHYELYQTSDLTPPATWMRVTNLPVVTGEWLRLALPVEAGSRYYQLRSP
jgi:alpha-mannosidase